MENMPLLVFTLLEELVVGAVIYFAIAYFGPSKVTSKELTMPLVVTFLVSGVALIASMFHLGVPFHAYNALRHLSESWISREILCYGGFLFFLVIVLFGAWKSQEGLFKAGLIGGVVCGLLCLVTTGLAYMVPSIVLWDHPATIGVMSLAAPMLGFPFGYLMLKGKGMGAKVLGIVELVCLVLSVALLGMLLSHLKSMGVAPALASYAMIAGPYAFTILLVIGAVVCGLCALASLLVSRGQNNISPTLVVFVMLAGVAVFELAQRLHFFLSVARY